MHCYRCGGVCVCQDPLLQALGVEEIAEGIAEGNPFEVDAGQRLMRGDVAGALADELLGDMLD